VTEPPPCPLLDDVIVIHAAPDDAAHVQSRSAVIVSVPVPPPAGAVGSEVAALT
jgi:hypothetical protein